MWVSTLIITDSLISSEFKDDIRLLIVVTRSQSRIHIPVRLAVRFLCAILLARETRNRNETELESRNNSTKIRKQRRRRRRRSHTMSETRLAAGMWVEFENFSTHSTLKAFNSLRLGRNTTKWNPKSRLIETGFKWARHLTLSQWLQLSN